MFPSIELLNDPSTLLCGLADGAAVVVAGSFPSQAAEYYYAKHQVFIVNRSIDIIAPHYVLNALIVLLCVGFLSWSLDSSHGPDIKYIEPSPQVPAEEKVVENISSIDPKADRRRTILKRTRARRLTIENIAKMIAIEDQKRQEVFGSSSSPYDNSVAAMDMGIGGGDVGLNVWSLNQEILLLREIDIQLEKDGLRAFAKPVDELKPFKQEHTAIVDKSTEKKAEVTQQEALPEASEEEESAPAGNKQPYSIDSAKKMDFKAHVLLRLRVPLRWVM